MKIPTNPLNSPKNFAPLTPNEDLKITTNGKPNFWEGLPIKLENKKTSNAPKIVPKRTTKELRL